MYTNKPEYFKQNVEHALSQPNLKAIIRRTTDKAEAKRAEAVANFPGFENARLQGMKVKDHTIKYMDHYLAEFEKTIDSFHKVIAAVGGENSGMIEFREQALNDLIQAYAEIDNGWQQARDYFLKEIGEKDTYAKQPLHQVRAIAERTKWSRKAIIDREDAIITWVETLYAE